MFQNELWLIFLLLWDWILEQENPTIAHNQENIPHVISAPLNQWASVLSGVVVEQERMLPILLDLLDSNSEMELRPLTGLLRNLTRHFSNKDHMGKIQTGISVVPVFFGQETLCVVSYFKSYKEVQLSKFRAFIEKLYCKRTILALCPF